jgi:hypothetical protein
MVKQLSRDDESPVCRRKGNGHREVAFLVSLAVETEHHSYSTLMSGE